MIKKFKHIRDNGTHSQKMRWVWGLSLITFATIVTVWGVYKTEEFSISASFKDSNSSESGVFTKVKKGLASVSTNFKEFVNTENTIEIENPQKENKVRAFPKINQ